MQLSSAPTFVMMCGVLAVFGLSSSAFFFLSRNADLKRRLYPWTLVLGWIFIGTLLVAMRAPYPAIALMLAIGIPIAWVNRRMMHFCDHCGRTVRDRTPFSQAAFCPRCGTHLHDR
jgi:hypothetical protein